MENLKKLRWRCRRGTLELDILLLRYLEKCYVSANKTEQQTFLELLDLEDIQLLPYLMGDKQPEESSTARLVNKIREL